MSTSYRSTALLAAGALLAAILAVVATAEPAQAASCPIEFYDCWNPSTNTQCTGTTSTVRTKTSPVGVVELRYKSSPCRHVWGRIVNAGSYGIFWTERVTSPTGNTVSLTIHSAGNSEWTKMMNDAGHASRAVVRIASGDYPTETY